MKASDQQAGGFKLTRDGVKKTFWFHPDEAEALRRTAYERRIKESVLVRQAVRRLLGIEDCWPMNEDDWNCRFAGRVPQWQYQPGGPLMGGPYLYRRYRLPSSSAARVWAEYILRLSEARSIYPRVSITGHVVEVRFALDDESAASRAVRLASDIDRSH